MAHMFEHMAFKGTRDWEREKEALEKVDRIYKELRELKLSRTGADPARVAELERAFREAQAEAGEYAASDELTRVIEQAGGTGLNASTSNDATRYYLSFPSNRSELWFSLESARFLDPVLREFYKERDVVLEERRMRVESQPWESSSETFSLSPTALIPTAASRSDGAPTSSSSPAGMRKSSSKSNTSLRT